MPDLGTERRTSSSAAFGAILIIVGLVAFAIQAFGSQIGVVFGESGWPLAVIGPGLVLLAAAVVPAPPKGLGFAIAGSIVTTIGLILLYQATTDDWQSWAYAWALIPAASGLGMAIYGLALGNGEFLTRGLRMAAVFGVAFAVGLWFFESLFRTGRAPLDLGVWWPLLVITLGVLIVFNGLEGRPRANRPDGDEARPLAGGDRQ
jgi:hypothetical protein